MVCENADANKGAAVWLLPISLLSAARGSYQGSMSSAVDAHRHRRVKVQNFNTYLTAIYNLLSKCATPGTISETIISVHRLRRDRFRAQEDADELAERAHKWGDVFGENERIKIFVEGLNNGIRRSTRYHW